MSLLTISVTCRGYAFRSYPLIYSLSYTKTHLIASKIAAIIIVNQFSQAERNYFHEKEYKSHYN